MRKRFARFFKAEWNMHKSQCVHSAEHGIEKVELNSTKRECSIGFCDLLVIRLASDLSFLYKIKVCVRFITMLLLFLVVVELGEMKACC